MNRGPLMLAVIGGALTLNGCGREDAHSTDSSHSEQGHETPAEKGDGTAGSHAEHERHPGSVHSTIERATGEAPDHTGTRQP